MENLTQKQSDILNSLKEEFIKLNSIERPKGKLSFLLDEIALKQEDQEEKEEQMKIYEILKNENYNKFLNEAKEIVDELYKLGFSNFEVREGSNKYELEILKNGYSLFSVRFKYKSVRTKNNYFEYYNFGYAEIIKGKNDYLLNNITSLYEALERYKKEVVA
jgi:hypothetical protein